MVFHYPKQAFAVYLQYRVINATCQIISGSALISIVELIKNITASFSIQKKKDAFYFVDISNIPECFLLSNKVFCIETL